MRSSRSDTNSAQTAVPAKRGRFSTNLAWNLANFVLNIAIGIWLVPYLIKNLGVAAYGLVPLVLQLTPYLQIITLSINAAVGRYLSIAIERGENERANRIFNTALFALVVLGAFLFVFGVVFAISAPELLRVPKGMEIQAQILAILAVCGFVLNELTLPFGVSMFCRNRFDIQNIINVIGTSLRVVTIVGLFTMFHPQIWHVGVSLFVASLVTSIGAVCACRRLTPMLHIWRGHYDRTLLKELTTIGGWAMVNQIGTLLFLSIDLIIVNRLFGADSGGRYAAVLTWSILLRGLAGTVAAVFGPSVLYYFAHQDFAGMEDYVVRAIKLMGVAMALPIGLIAGFASPILTVWLGPSYASLGSLMTLMTAHLCVNLAVLPLFNVQQSTNNVKWPGIMTIVTGTLNVGLALFLSTIMGWGFFGVAAAGAIMLTLKNTMFTTIYTSKLIGKSSKPVFFELGKIVCATLFVSGACLIIKANTQLDHIGEVVGWSFAITALYSVVALTFILNQTDRSRLIAMITRTNS